MANYSYTKVTPRKAASWIDHLEKINPASSASSHYTEIHFTVPKSTTASTLTNPHVTFIAPSTTNHWYMKNSNGKYVLETRDTAVCPDEAKIADKVLSDAVELNWVIACPQPQLVDDDGFTTKESKGGKKSRMRQTLHT